MKWLKATLRGLAAAVIFLGFIGMFYFWEPLLRLITLVVRV